MYGHVIHARPQSGEPLRDIARIARRLYYADKAKETVERMEEDRRWPPRTIRMPNCRGMTVLGELLEVHCAEVDRRGNPTGALRIVKWSRGRGPVMLWSTHLSAVVAFPGTAIEPPVHELDERDEAQAEILRIWTKGSQEAYGKGDIMQPDPPMQLYGPAIATMYASDKFTRRGQPARRPFLHHHDQGVELWVSTPRWEGRSGVVAIMVRGGDLRVTEDGLAG